MKIFTPKNISKWMIVLPIFGILLTTIIILVATTYTIHINFQKQKQLITKEFILNLKKTAKDRVNLAYGIIDTIYKNETQHNASKKEIICMIQQVLDKLRWDKKGYIFVFDYKGNTIFHINKHYMKINRWNWERHGVKVVRNLIIASLKNPAGTYVKYLAYNPNGTPIEKISYLKIYKPLKIIIGSGVYLNYLNKKLLQNQQTQQNLSNTIIKNIIFISILTTLLLIVVMYILSSKIKNIFKRYNKEIEKEKEKLFIRANFDTLTGLYNREHFLCEAQKALNTIRRDNSKLAIMFIDIDRFKEINDSKGHDTGDKVLKIIADRLNKSVRPNDIVSRFGGDEFVVLFNNILDKYSPIELSQRLLETIKEPIIIDNQEHYISASIGISIAPDDAIKINHLIKYADTAMYKSKEQGKDRFNFYKPEMTQIANERLALKRDLFRAIKNQEFEIYFQPQIDSHNKLFGAEVLIRWNHPTKGLISPINFIPLAIEIGIIESIDLWVIEQSIRQHKKWQKQGFEVGVLSCNITIYHLEKGSLARNLELLLKKYDFDPKYLNIEITEEGVMKNVKKSIKMLNKIQKLGIHINIDDFGTGYSSLAYLKKLPISKLKIDRSFIKDIPQDADDMAITKTIVNLAKNLNLKLIAEGVETKEQQQFVFAQECDYIQGYFYSKPINAQDFEEKFLKEKDDLY